MSEALAAQADPPLEVAQPLELFDEATLPLRPDLEEMVKERSYLPATKPDAARFSGKIVIRRMLNNAELCEMICTALLLDYPARLIGRRFNLSPRSVANIRDAMGERGELAPVRQRIAKKLDRVIELGLEYWEEGIIDGSIHKGQIPIPTLAAIDKKGQLEAGIVPGTDVTVGEAAEANIRAAWTVLAAAKLAAATQADGATGQVIDVTAPSLPEPAPDTKQDTTPAPVQTPGPTSGPTAAAAPGPGGAEGGGGDRPPAGAPGPRCLPPENFGP